MPLMTIVEHAQSRAQSMAADLTVGGDRYAFCVGLAALLAEYFGRPGLENLAAEYVARFFNGPEEFQREWDVDDMELEQLLRWCRPMGHTNLNWFLLWLTMTLSRGDPTPSPA